MARAGSVLVLVILAGGCVPLRVPTMDPVVSHCEVLASPRSEVRDEALTWLEREFVHPGEWGKYKCLPDPQRDQLATCMPALARLLSDRDPAVRDRARSTMSGIARRLLLRREHRVPAGSDGVVLALVRDGERLWRATDLQGGEGRHRGVLLARDLDLLARYRTWARPALPLAEAILAGPDLPVYGADAGQDPLRPPLPPVICPDEPRGALVQDSAARLRWSIGGELGPPPTRWPRVP